MQNNKVQRFCNAIDDWMSLLSEVLPFQVRAIIQSALAVSVPLYTSVDHSESLAELTLTCNHCSQSLVFPSQHAPASEGWPFRTGVQFKFSLSPLTFNLPNLTSFLLSCTFLSTQAHIQVCVHGLTHTILRCTQIALCSVLTCPPFSLIWQSSTVWHRWDNREKQNLSIMGVFWGSEVYGIIMEGFWKSWALYWQILIVSWPKDAHTVVY